MRDEPYKLLFVDDERKAGEVFSRFCRVYSYECEVFQDPRKALERFVEDGAQMVISDLRMPEMDGVELLKRVRERDTGVPFIIISAYSTVNAAIDAFRLGATDFIKKPFEMEELFALINRTLESARLKDEVRLLRRQIRDGCERQGLIGGSKAIKEVYSFVEKVADVRCNVIIQGESGTGKELLARSIHKSGSEPERPFVVVDCGALSDTLLESELFGHERGAFTGATSTKRGLLETASGGTVFLDEIGNISDTMQIKLLRVIQEQQIVRVGGLHPIDIDARWLVASNQDLEELVREGRFRADLYHRLNVVKVWMPPLRERPDDIPFLVQHFVDHFNGVYKRNVTGFDGASAKRLMAYGWPGNVRELRNLVERHIVLADGLLMKVEELPQQSADSLCNIGDQPTLSELERRYILRVLERVGGNQRKAAEILGIDKSTLWRKLQSYKRAESAFDGHGPDP